MYHDDQFFMTSFSQIKLFCQIKVLLLHKQIISVIFLDDFFTLVLLMYSNFSE